VAYDIAISFWVAYQFLCLFMDLCLTSSSWQVAFTGLVYPCLVLAYMGEAAYLSKHKMDLHSSFYMAIPGKA
jgi:KUP system potassium uptake protein